MWRLHNAYAYKRDFVADDQPGLGQGWGALVIFALYIVALLMSLQELF